MVIILSKTLEKKKGVDNVRPTDTESLLRQLRIMSRGSALLSRGTVETDRWLDLGLDLNLDLGLDLDLEGLWSALPECRRRSRASWGREADSAASSSAATAAAITGLICELNLGSTSPSFGPAPLSAAPPSKRQCRSLSLSDGRRSPWRPQGSRVWTAVEKRRCHSGGSVQRSPGGVGAVGGISGGIGRHFPAMQRSSSLSLPACGSAFPPVADGDGALELPCFARRLPPPLFTASSALAAAPFQRSHAPLRPLSLSHEHISLPGPRETGEEEEAGSPDSAPGELGGRRSGGPALGGGLSRSRSQPCVLNHKKAGMKRRRTEDAQEQRPSLDLAKMTQKLRTFHSLSCPGISASPDCHQSQPPPSSWSISQSDSESDLGVETHQEVGGDEEEDESSYEKLDSDSACSACSRPGSPGGLGEEEEEEEEEGGRGRRPLWKGDGGTGKDVYQLGGELDIDQIERN